MGFLTAEAAHALSCTWTRSAGSANFNASTTYWSCAVIPDSDDDVIFSSSGTSTCTITSSVTVNSLTMNSGAGTVTQNSGDSLTTLGNFTINSGTFNGGDTKTVIGGNFSQTNGTFNATSNRLEVNGSFSKTSGTFTAGTGEVMLRSAGSNTFATNGVAFYDLIINDGMVGYWPLNETSGTTAYNKSGFYTHYGYSGTAPTQSSTSLAPLNFANARHLTFAGGSTTVASVASFAPYEMDVTDSYTLSAWVKATNLSGSLYQGVITFGRDVAQWWGLWMDSSEKWVAGGPTNATGGAATGSWQHVAIVQTGSGVGNRRYIYIDGVDTTVGTPTAADGNSGLGGTMILGRGFTSNEYFTGSIDDIRVYDRALSTTEIAALAAGNSPQATGGGIQTLTGSPSVTNDFTLGSGTFVLGANIVTVAGNWWNYGGILTATSSGGVTFNGSTAGKYIQTGGSTMGDLTIAGTGSGAWAISDTGDVKVAGDFTQSGGAFTSTPALLNIQGAFNKTSGTFTHNSGHVMLSSTSSQTFASNGATFNDLTINDGLVGYWKIDESAGPTAYDSSGYGNDVAFASGGNAPTISALVPTVNFQDAQSALFNGATPQWMKTAAIPTELQPTVVTVAAWYKATSVDTAGSEVVSGSNRYAIRVLSSTQIQVIKQAAASTWVELTATVTTPLDGNWHHIAGVITGSGMTAYYDGVSRATNVDTSAIYYGGTLDGLQFGGNPTTGNYDFTGNIDEARVYNRALSATEIYSMYIGNQPGSASATHTLTGNPIIVGDLVIASGGLAAGTTSITVGGSWWNYGGLFTTGTSGTVTFNGSGSTNKIRAAGQTFQDLTINGSGTWTLAERVEIAPNRIITMTAGTLNLSSYNLRVGDINRNGAVTITPSTGTVVMDTDASRTLDTGTFYNLRFEPVAATNLKAYWKLDAGQGSSIRDYSGSANTGTLYSANWIDSSLPGITFYNPAAVTFSGSSGSYATLGVTNLPAVASAMTVSLWVYYASVPASTQNFIALMGGSNTQIGFRGSEIRAWKSGGITLVAKSSPPSSGWHHVVYTCDGAGTPTHTLTIDGGTPVSTATALTAGTTSTAWLATYNGTNELFAGNIDDVRIYNAVLTAAEINALAAGTNPAGLAGTPSYTIGYNTTVTGTLSVDNGTVATSSYTVDASATGNVATVYSGTYSVGSATNTFQGGLTVSKYGTLALPTTGGIVSIGPASAVTKVLTIDGTLSASAATAATIQKTSGANNYTFTVGSTSTATPTLDITRLAVKNTDTNGMYINTVAGSATTFTNFDNIAFSSGTGNYLLRIYSESLALYANGLTFDASTTYNMKLAGNGTGDGESRAYIGATCTSTPCESYDVDDDANNDGTGDAGGATDEAVAQWMYKAYDDTAGSIEGFPTTAFNWTTFVYWNTYAVYRDFSGSTDRLFARDTDGDFKNTAGGAGYYWDLPSSVGDIIGTPRWTMEGATHYVYVITTLGYVYKLTDSGTAFALVTAQAWPYRNGASATATSPLAMDGSNIYWAGNDGSGNRKMFSLTFAMALNGTRTVVADIVAAPSLASISGTTYLFTGTNGSIYRTPTNLASELTSTQPTSIVYGRTSVVNGTVYFPEDIGKVWAISGTDLTATPTGAGKWSYQDTDGTRHPGGCTAASQCTVRNIYHDAQYQRTYFGDKDGHLYVVSNTGALISGYPFRPGTSSDEFQTAPLYRAGVIVIGAVSGRVFVVDQSAAVSAYQTFDFQSPVSTISYDTDGKYIVGTASGKLYYLNGVTDPTPGSL